MVGGEWGRFEGRERERWGIESGRVVIETGRRGKERRKGRGWWKRMGGVGRGKGREKERKTGEWTGAVSSCGVTRYGAPLVRIRLSLFSWDLLNRKVVSFKSAFSPKSPIQLCRLQHSLSVLWSSICNISFPLVLVAKLSSCQPTAK